MAAKKRRKKKPGRPKGTTVPLERDRQKFEIAIWHGIRLFAPRQCGRGNHSDRRARQHPSPAARGLRRGIGPYISGRAESRWAQLPAKPQVRDGELVHDSDGKTQYFHLMNFDSREVSDAFNRAVIRAVLEFAPAAFEREEV